MQATIHTPAVYSKEADPSAVPPEIAACIPRGWRLSEHQLATYQALLCKDVDIVINSAMTGDGKSIAGLLPYISGQNTDGLLALYPTNELIRDQERSARSSLEQWHKEARDVATLYSAKLDELFAQAEMHNRTDVLLRELKRSAVVLTNPDILHAMVQFVYYQHRRDPTNILTTITQSFRQLTFDEFHIFDSAQVTAVMIGLLLLYEQTGHPLKTLFLSATPDGLLMEMLHRAGFDDQRIRQIVPQQEGWYAHGDRPGEGWRDILQASSITFVDQRPEEWVPAQLENIILGWFRSHGKQAKAALIVNSVAKALRLTALLKERLAPEGLTVMPNTGMTGREDRRLSYQADLLVGTSTVDVGVDFHINLLIFEADNAGSFIQRLGRLGRHKNYTDRSGTIHPFNKFAAYALVPPFVFERLFSPRDTQQPPLMTDGETVSRETLGQHIRSEYPSYAEFKHYARHWGRFQAAKVFDTLIQRRETFAPLLERLQPRYNNLLQTSVLRAMRTWRSLHKTDEERPILEAQSFRGGSPFECGVLQQSETGGEEIVTYNLFMLMANFQLELLDKQKFLQIAKQPGVNTMPYERKPPRQIAYFRRLKMLDSFQEVTVELDPAIAEWELERYQSAHVLSGLRLDCPIHPWLDDLNEGCLCTYKVVALLVRGYHPLELRRRLYLPGTFAIRAYRFGGEDLHDGSIVFGREALLLDSRLRYKKLEMPGGGAYFA